MGSGCHGRIPKLKMNIPKRDVPDTKTILRILNSKIEKPESFNSKTVATKMKRLDPYVDLWKPWQLRPYVEVVDETIKSSKKSHKVILEKTIPPIQKVLENNKNSIGESLIKFEAKPSTMKLVPFVSKMNMTPETFFELSEFVFKTDEESEIINNVKQIFQVSLENWRLDQDKVERIILNKLF